MAQIVECLTARIMCSDDKGPEIAIATRFVFINIDYHKHIYISHLLVIYVCAIYVPNIYITKLLNTCLFSCSLISCSRRRETSDMGKHHKTYFFHFIINYNHVFLCFVHFLYVHQFIVLSALLAVGIVRKTSHSVPTSVYTNGGPRIR